MLVGCSDALEQTTAAGDIVVSLNTQSGNLTLVTVEGHNVTFVPVAPSGATLGGLATLGTLVAASGGDSAALTVFDFTNGAPPTDTTWRFPEAAAASGVALGADSIAWIANPTRNAVTRLNIGTGGRTSVPVGVFPQAVVVANATVYVANSNLVGGVPAGPSWLTVLSASGAPAPVDSIPLSGTNADQLTLGADGFLYVVDAGTPGAGDGKLSIVDTSLKTEAAVVNGLGESPGGAVYHPTGRLLVASRTAGILEVNTSTRTLVRGPGSGIKPEGAGVAALALDEAGRVYAFDQGDCTGPGTLHILEAPPSYEEFTTLPVGVCPSAAVTLLVP